uniref:BPTI/Kunitz inhibitor domain-containing protein n=1 Tax=Meloidogyne floridensis TaxID=298350 RepID=A0A915NSA1_9BILA
MPLKIRISLIVIISTLFSLIASLPAPPIFERVPHYPGLCYLPPESGLCSTIELQQKSPVQTGLENNINEQFNKFSEEEKLNKWETSVENEENILDETKLNTKFYFDSVTAQCYAFSTQECGGNQNRFDSVEECLDVCKLEF